jgi:transposase
MRRHKAEPTLARRAKIILACSTGKTHGSVAMAAGVARQTVGRWCRRFVGKGLAGLVDEPRLGAPRRITEAKVQRVVRLTLGGPGAERPLSTRAIARRCRLSQTAVSRIRRAALRRSRSPLPSR